MKFQQGVRMGLLSGVITLSGCLEAGRPSVSLGALTSGITQYTIEEFLGTTRLLGNSFSPDNTKILVSSDQGGVYNAHALHVDSGVSVQLTDSKQDAVQVQGYFPHDERFLYLADEGGDELDHLYVRELDGTRTDLTPGRGHRARFIDWSRDGDSLFVGTNERDKGSLDLYEVRLDNYQRSKVYQNDRGYELKDISPDKRYIALEKIHARHDRELLIYDRRQSLIKPLAPGFGGSENRFQAFSEDGKRIYFTSNKGSEFAYLVQQEIETGAHSVVVQADWDVVFATLSRRDKYLAVSINNDAKTELRILDGSTMNPLELPALPKGDITSISFARDESAMAFYGSTSRTPPNLYIYDFQRKRLRRLTQTLSPEVDEHDLVDAQIVRFTSYDGLEIPGLLYRPHGASSKNRVPALVWVHGGPGGQSKIRYNALIQYLASQGYAVYAINNRGSSGYGKTFFRADDRRHGSADLADCIAGKQMLAQTGFIDSDRIGIIGTSYGGYLVLAALSFHPGEFTVGVDQFGVSNWISTLESMPPWWEPLRKALLREIGDPATERDYLKRISPFYAAHKIVSPLLVLQGANDPRVTRTESDAMVAAVNANGVPVEYLVFDNEGHGLRSKVNRLKAYRAIGAFLDRHLKRK